MAQYKANSSHHFYMSNSCAYFLLTSSMNNTAYSLIGDVIYFGYFS